MTHPFRVSKHPPAKASPSQGVGRKHPAPLTSQRARLARPTWSVPQARLSKAQPPPFRGQGAPSGWGGGGWSWPGPCLSSSPGGVKLGASGSLPFPGPPPGPPESAGRRCQRVILWKEGGAARTAGRGAGGASRRGSPGAPTGALSGAGRRSFRPCPSCGGRLAGTDRHTDTRGSPALLAPQVAQATHSRGAHETHAPAHVTWRVPRVGRPGARVPPLTWPIP